MKFLISLLPLIGVAMVLADDSPASRLVASNNKFSVNLFSEVEKKEPGKSKVMSGLSVLFPLTQLMLASNGPSHDEILQTIGLPDDETAKTAFSSLNTNLRSVKGVELKIANRVYIPESAQLNDTFAEVSRNVFGSDVKNVNFNENAKAAAAINSWVEENTNNRIKDLIDPDSLGPDTAAVLVNAIYFKGSWKEKFNKHATMDRDFHVSKDKTVKVPTMYKKAEFMYGESEELDAQLIKLFYEGDETYLLIVLPKQIDGIDALQEKIKDPSILDHAVNNMYSVEVEVYLPKFKIETTIDLKDVLVKMGIKKLFSPAEARLDYLVKSTSDLYVSAAIQKAFMEVNEEGAEAAAASEVTIDVRFGQVEPDDKYIFMADKAFYFVLSNNESGLFTGVYYS